MTEFLWVMTIICSVIGLFVAVAGVLGANGAPQEAAAAAMGMACAVIPYCITRAASEIGAGRRREANADAQARSHADTTEDDEAEGQYPATRTRRRR